MQVALLTTPLMKRIFEHRRPAVPSDSSREDRRRQDGGDEEQHGDVALGGESSIEDGDLHDDAEDDAVPPPPASSRGQLLSLHPYQEKPARFLRTHHGVIVAHATGSGKTLTAVHTVQTLFKELPQSTTALIVTPKSLQTNFKKSLLDYGVSEADQSRYVYVTKDSLSGKLKRGVLDCAGKIVVVDEAHFARNTDTKLYNTLLACSAKAARVVLLTATPVYNDVTDVASLLRIVRPNSEKASPGALLELLGKQGDSDPSSAARLANMLQCAFSVADGDRSYFPTEIPHVVHLRMTQSYLANYNAAERLIIPEDVRLALFQGKDIPRADAFMSHLRRVINADFEGESNPKLDWIQSFLTQKWPSNAGDSRKALVSGPGKVLVSTEWGAAGAALIAQRCETAGVPCIIYSGAINAQWKRDALVEYYNSRPADEMLCMILTKAGGVGLDLKETKYVIVLDVMWNPSCVEQAVARAVRYKSHSRADAEVNVYYLVLEKPPASPIMTWLVGEKVSNVSSDQLFMRRIARKREEKEKLMRVIRSVSIENPNIACPPTASQYQKRKQVRLGGG